MSCVQLWKVEILKVGPQLLGLSAFIYLVAPFCPSLSLGSSLPAYTQLSPQLLTQGAGTDLWAWPPLYCCALKISAPRA